MTGIENDVRLILAENIAKYLEQMVKNRKIPLSINRQKILTRLSEINSKIMALKWSYQPLEQVLHSKQLRDIEIFAKDIFDSFPENWEETLASRGQEGKLTSKILKYMRNFFYTLRARITDGFSDDYADAIEILCGEIQSIEKVDATTWKCLVTDGIDRYHVVTNIEDLKKGDVVPIAKLPPQIVHGVLSEGMFMGSSKGIQKFSKEEVGKKPTLTDKELGQSRGIIERFFVSK